MILLQAAIAAGLVLMVILTFLLIIVLPTCIYVMYQKELGKLEDLDNEVQKSKLFLFLISLLKALFIFTILSFLIFTVLHFTIDLTYS